MKNSKNITIRVKNLSKSFLGLDAIKDVSFNIQTGNIYGLLGKNGAGKTTTLKILSGMMKQTSGDISVELNSTLVDLETFRTKIGYLSENIPLYQEMKVYEYLEFICAINNVSKENIKSFVNKAILETECIEFKNRPISTLSKGMRQRVGIAGVICYQPELIILDEPFTGLDPFSLREIKALITKLSKSRSIIISSHRLNELVNLCSYFFILEKGELIFDGPVNKVKNFVVSENQTSLKLWVDEIENQISLSSQIDNESSIEIQSSNLNKKNNLNNEQVSH